MTTMPEGMEILLPSVVLFSSLRKKRPRSQQYGGAASQPPGVPASPPGISWFSVARHGGSWVAPPISRSVIFASRRSLRDGSHTKAQHNQNHSPHVQEAHGRVRTAVVSAFALPLPSKGAAIATVTASARFTFFLSLSFYFSLSIRLSGANAPLLPSPPIDLPRGR